MIRLGIFVVVSIGIAVLSRASLVRPRSHGFYRFFAWEAILGLILINCLRWFEVPFSPRQLASWILLCASLVPLFLGVRQLRVAGRPDPSRSDEGALLGIEKTTELVTTGIFRFIRHPLYSSLLLLAWGAFLKGPSLDTVALALAATALLVVTARVEERENIRYFGRAYRDYMRGTKMFLPCLF